MSFDNHLSSNKNIRITIGKFRQNLFMSILTSCSVHIHS